MLNAALLRGINVGGKNKLPMTELAAIFAAAGCKDVRTYIQSGNVVFRASPKVMQSLAAQIESAIVTSFGLRVPVVLRSAEEMARVLTSNPFLKAGAPANTLHVVFLADEPDAAGADKLDPNRSPGDQFVLLGREIYFNLPNGAGRTKLTSAYFDSRLKTVGTMRNWNTVTRLVEMTRE